MSIRTANWVSRTTPGSAPPPPSRVPSAPPPPTVYPESSVSNPNASRYTGRPSRSQSVSSYRSASSHHTSGSGSRHSSHHSGSSYHTSGSHHTARQPMQTFYANPEEPIIAKTSSASGRTSSYMIIPAHGHKVEILQPKRAATVPVPSSSSSSYYSSASRKDEPLLKRLFNKVEWDADKGSSSGRSRRNSTGGSTVISGRSGGYSVISGGSSARGGTVINARDGTVISGSGTRVTSTSGRVYEVHYA